jgi:hypothetical protein
MRASALHALRFDHRSDEVDPHEEIDRRHSQRAIVQAEPLLPGQIGAGEFLFMPIQKLGAPWRWRAVRAVIAEYRSVFLEQMPRG